MVTTGNNAVCVHGNPCHLFSLSLRKNEKKRKTFEMHVIFTLQLIRKYLCFFGGGGGGAFLFVLFFAGGVKLKKNMNATKPSEHPPDRGKNCRNV